jgi:hypothetical protein
VPSPKRATSTTYGTQNRVTTAPRTPLVDLGRDRASTLVHTPELERTLRVSTDDLHEIARTTRLPFSFTPAGAGIFIRRDELCAWVAAARAFRAARKAQSTHGAIYRTRCHG